MKSSLSPPRSVHILEVKCLNPFILSVVFSDDSEKILDFTSAFSGLSHKFSNEDFQKVQWSDNLLYWGEQMEIAFPVRKLHRGEIEMID